MRDRLLDGSVLGDIPILDVAEAWAALAARPYATPVDRVKAEDCELANHGETERVLRAGQAALDRRADILGSGEIELGTPIDWLKDYKSGASWRQSYAPAEDFADLHRDSDVKTPWELSRLQWLIPAGLAYRITGDERFAAGVRDILDEWIDGNPFGMTVNWAIAMEAAIRIVSWTWFFHVFAASKAWADETFRRRFLSVLYAHADFVDRHIERSDVNGNHYTADAMGLTFAGLFFLGRGRGDAWAGTGWRILSEEITRQVQADGVNFEASTAYHRFVAEMFALSALYRAHLGLPIDPSFRTNLRAMGEFAKAYSRLDGSTPLWGDADNGRVLPLGSQQIGDHRYLPDLIDTVLGTSGREKLSPNSTEVFWLTGRRGGLDHSAAITGSATFRDAGVYVMRNARDHIFVDCGPVGMAGRGGHGHNDCLSFEAVLDGLHLISDSGTYTYTGSVQWRNRFRGTTSHNTPMIDGEELNRFIDPELLWSLHNDAVPEILEWRSGADSDFLRARHGGYRRLRRPVIVERSLSLNHRSHSLTVRDVFLGVGEHQIQEAFILATGVAIVGQHKSHYVLERDGRRFDLRWDSPGSWDVAVMEHWISASYGVKSPSLRIELRRAGELCPITLTLSPNHDSGPSSDFDHPASAPA